jgi:hypothetical protein
VTLREQLAPRPGQRAQRLGLIAVGPQRGEAPVIGARQLARHHRVRLDALAPDFKLQRQA